MPEAERRKARNVFVQDDMAFGAELVECSIDIGCE